MIFCSFIFIFLFSSCVLSNENLACYQRCPLICQHSKYHPIPQQLSIEGQSILESAGNKYENEAGILFKKVLALFPKNPTVLNDYGEYIEEEDISNAVHHYHKSIYLNPEDEKAMQNFERTFPLLLKWESELFGSIDKKLEQLSHVERDGNWRRLKKETEFMHIYHTNRIEGNTLSYTQTRTILETGIITSASFHESAEVVASQNALDLILKLSENDKEVSIPDILLIHKHVLGN